jgi:hypothetical protein
MSSSINWRENAHDSTKLDKTEFSNYKNEMEKMIVALQGTVQTLQGTVQTLTKQTKQEILKLKKVTKPLRKSMRLEDKLLAQQDELIKNNKFEKGKILEMGFAERFKKKYPDRDTTKWKKYVKFTSGGVTNWCNPRLSASSPFFKNPKATPRHIRLFIQRIYNTRK